jgi:hypothetical protein
VELEGRVYLDCTTHPRFCLTWLSEAVRGALLLDRLSHCNLDEEPHCPIAAKSPDKMVLLWLLIVEGRPRFSSSGGCGSSSGCSTFIDVQVPGGLQLFRALLPRFGPSMLQGTEGGGRVHMQKSVGGTTEAVRAVRVASVNLQRCSVACRGLTVGSVEPPLKRNGHCGR